MVLLTGMTIKRIIILLGLISLLLVGGVIYKIGRSDQENTISDITNFTECAEAGYPVMESYPRQCKTPDGRNFTEDVGPKDDKNNLIRLFDPRQNEEIASPVTITGEARGTWYFEATFPVVVVDWDGLIIGEGYAEAQSNPDASDGAGWMTEDFVPFRGTITFKTPTYQNYGALILQKSNPSGLSEHDDALEIPVLFRDAPQPDESDTPETGRERGGCMVTGCSGQVCADHDAITTCEFRPEYACYQDAVCERQADKQCGWTLTSAVGRCLMELDGGGGGEELVAGVSGTVLIGPTCPVIQEGKEEECKDKPYKTTVNIFSKNNSTFPIQSVDTDAEGTFSAELIPGRYILRAEGGSTFHTFPRCSDEEITVPVGGLQDVIISCDTGIR